MGNVLMTVENTDEKSFWLVNYLEPLLLQVWYPSTVATLSAEIRKLCSFYLDVTSETYDNLPFMLHDFGFRGASSVESSRLAGSAHLLSFQGTDTLSSQTIPRNYYYYPGVAGYSVQATEHSVMTSLGEKGEYEQVEYILDNAYDGVISLVIDSYNYRKFLQEISTHNTRLNKKVLEYISRGFEKNGIENKVVFRPDSGEPVSVTLDCLNILGEGFGTHYNKKGYKEFNTNIGLLWGDGLNYQKIRDILFNMKNNKWSSNVIIFGMGGGLHTGVNRDTQRNAFKCSAQYRNNKWYDIYKNPLDSSKKSKQGLLKLIRGADNGEYKTVPKQVTGKDCLQTVFLDGELKSKNIWMHMRQRVGKYYG